MMRTGLICLAILALAGCATNEGGTAAAPADGTAVRTAWVPDGAPVSCISTQRIRAMRVIDDRTIDFELSGQARFRNNLPTRCPGLTFNRAIRHNSRTSQLCSANTITVIGGAGASGPTCPLGRFQPMTRAEVPAEATPPAPPPS